MLRKSTKVIWSIQVDETTQNIKPSFDLCDAVRVIYLQENNKKTLNYLDQHFRTTKQKTLIIDVSQHPRGFLKIKNSNSQKISPGETLKIGRNQGELYFEIDSKDIDSKDKDFKKDTLIYIGYHDVVLKVEKVSEQEVTTIVVQGDELYSGTEIYIPSTKIPPSIFDLSFINIKDYLHYNIDAVILPGIPSARQVALVKKKLSLYTKKIPWVIVKIDSQEIYHNLDEILNEADGVLISRKELSLTIEPAAVPIVCKEIIGTVKKHNKISFIASDILISMRDNSIPTRAEVSDIANSAIDNADAIVIASDICLGDHSNKSLELSNKIISQVEQNYLPLENWQIPKLQIKNEVQAITYQAYKTSERIKAKTLVCLTHQGNTVLKLASYNPPIPIIALTFSKDIKQKLSLIRGVTCLCLEPDLSLDEVLPSINNLLKQNAWLKVGDYFVFVSITLSSLSSSSSNLFTAQQVH
jgi:pyruvate kinase